MVKFVNFFAFAAVALGATIPVVKANQPKGELHSLSVTAIKEVTAELTEDEEEVENNQIETDINKAIVTAELDSGGRRGRKLKTFGADFRGEAFCLFGVRDVTDYFEADKPKADMDVGETCLLEFTDVEFKTKMEECSSSPTGWCKKIDYKAHFWFIEAANPIIVNYPGNWLTFSITVRSLMEGAVIDALKEVDGSEEDLVWEYLKDVWLIADPHIKTWSGKWYGESQ